MSFMTVVWLLCSVTALALSLPGMYIVLHKRAIMVDAISHALLPGVVVGFLITHSITSPLLLVTATCTSLVLVFGLNMLERSGLIAKNGANGLLVTPLLAFAVLAVTAFASNLHLDTHTVLLGDLNLIAFDEACIAGTCYGPKHLYLMGALLLLNLFVFVRWQKNFTVLVFDREFAKLNRLRPRLFHTMLLILTAVSVTGGFAATGAVLALAIVVLPAATARLISNRIASLLPLTLGFALIGSTLGFFICYVLNLPTSAGIAFVLSLLFLLVYAARGLWLNRRARQGLQRALADQPRLLQAPA